MTTFVDTSVLLSGQQQEDQDPVIVVIRSAQAMLRDGMKADSAAFEKAFAEKYSEKDWSGIFGLLLSTSPVIFGKLASVADSDEAAAGRIAKTAEGYMEVIISVLSKLDSVESVIQRITAFVDVVSTSAPSSPAVDRLRMKLLTTLFSTLSPRAAALRLLVTVGLVRLATTDAGKESVYALLSDFDLYAEDLSVEEKLRAFSLIASVANGEAKLKWMQLLAETAESATEKSNLWTKVVVESVRTPSFVGFRDLLTRVAGINVEESAMACLTVLAKGTTFQALEAFLASSEGAKFVSTHGVNADELREKMRILILPALIGADRASVSLAEIAKETHSADPVSVIVRCIRSGLIRGTIDEVAGQLRVTAVASTEVDWTKLSATLKMKL